MVVHGLPRDGSPTDGSLPAPDATIGLTRAALITVMLGGADPAPLLVDGTITSDGMDAALATLMGLLDDPDPDFTIVTP